MVRLIRHISRAQANPHWRQTASSSPGMLEVVPLLVQISQYLRLMARVAPAYQMIHPEGTRRSLLTASQLLIIQFPALVITKSFA
jgi:hypothetical protein